jgi:DNA-binding transcriptional regulator LsrR (DeoR family)
MPGNKEAAEYAQMRDIAKLFYREQHTKEDIAESLGIPRRRVADLLERARQLGIVRIYVEDERVHSPLEEQLKVKHPHLQDVFVVPCEKVETDGQYTSLLKQLADMAARYFQDLLDHHEGDIHVGVSGGETVLEFVTAIPNQSREKLHVYATSCVGRGPAALRTSHVDPAVNATILWSKSGRLPGHCHYATVPPCDIPKSKYPSDIRPAVAAEVEKLAARRPIRMVIEQMDELDVAFAGLGIVKPPQQQPALVNRITMTSLLKPLCLEIENDLAHEGAVGDLSYCLFSAEGLDIPKDIDGRSMQKEDWRFFLSAGHYSKHSGLEFYKDMVRRHKKVVVIAGPFKIPAVLGALKAEAFNVFATDEHSAREILHSS